MISQYINMLKRASVFIVPALLALVLQASAKGGGQAPVPSTMENPVVITMVIIILVLLLAIALLSFVVMGAMDIYKDKMVQKGKSISSKIPLSIILLVLSSYSSMAQDAAPAAGEVIIYGVANSTFYMLFAIVVLEMLVLFALLYNLRILLGMERKKKVVPVSSEAAKDGPFSILWQKLNKAKPIEQEADIDMGHSYDGIRELDNRLPPWWLYGFYLCIIISIVYMWRFHVSHSGPSSLEEYKYAMEEGERQKLDYLKNAANNVDENTIIYLSDEASIAGGKEAFVTMCATCHGKAGEGGVGPNLADDYWLHGGSIKDVFKSIKYGWPDKGMRSWQEDYSPKQLAQIASFVKSLRGTNPPNAKDKQGELFVEEAAVPDSVQLSTVVVESK